MDHVHQIRNPLEWLWEQFRLSGHAVGAGVQAAVGGDEAMAPERHAVRRITTNDLKQALASGLQDFAACRTDVMFLCLIYPIAGLVLAQIAFGHDLLPMIFPLASGFALLGPVAAMGLYEISRRRERGLEVSWADAFQVLRSPAFGAMLTLGLLLVAIFAMWLMAAYAVYAGTLGPDAPVSTTRFVHDVFMTPGGWAMIVIGLGVGFLFAAAVLVISVVSFPLLLDRDVGLYEAVATSVRAVRANPGPMALWGLIVAGGLLIGSLPMLVGLAVVMPVLGHATWHLYRRVVLTEPRA